MKRTLVLGLLTLLVSCADANKSSGSFEGDENVKHRKSEVQRSKESEQEEKPADSINNKNTVAFLEKYGVSSRRIISQESLKKTLDLIYLMVFSIIGGSIKFLNFSRWAF